MGLLQGAGICKLMPASYGKFHEKNDGATKKTWNDLSNSKKAVYGTNPFETVTFTR